MQHCILWSDTFFFKKNNVALGRESCNSSREPGSDSCFSTFMIERAICKLLLRNAVYVAWLGLSLQ